MLKDVCSEFPLSDTSQGRKFIPEWVEQNCKELRGELKAVSSQQHGWGPAESQPGNRLE